MKQNRIFVVILAVLCFFCLNSCAHKSGHLKADEATHNYENSDGSNASSGNDGQKISGHTVVKMRKENGVYLVPITINGMNLDFIFDTGASSISLSAAEATVMAKQGKITQDDVVGQDQFTDATGAVSVGTVIRLRTVQIGDITLENVEASVVDNIEAPLLLGQSALQKFGKLTIDYNNNTIEFN